MKRGMTNMAKTKALKTVGHTPVTDNPRFYRTDYAGGTRPGYCVTQESATCAAIRHILLDGYTSATISCMITGADLVRLRISDNKTQVIVKAVKEFKAKWRKN